LLGATPNFPYVLSSHGAGTLAAVGAQIHRFKEGDHAYATALIVPKGRRIFTPLTAARRQGSVNSCMKFSPRIDLSRKSRFRLTIEVYLCCFVCLAGSLFLPYSLLVAAPVALYYVPLLRELKSRRQLLTRSQKSVLFGIQVGFCGTMVLGCLALAFSRKTPMAWIVLALTSVTMLVALYYGYDQIYNEPRH